MAASLSFAGCGWLGIGRKKLAPFETDAMRLGVVTPFGYGASDKAYADLPKPMGDSLSRALFETKRLRVIDRQRLDSTLQELQLPVGVPLDSSQIAKVCDKLKAEVAVYGQITSVQKEERKKGKRTVETLQVDAEAKLVFAKTAEILSTARASGSASVAYASDKRPPSELLTNAALADAAKQLAHQLVVDLQPK
jgi:hypothetical protein